MQIWCWYTDLLFDVHMKRQKRVTAGHRVHRTMIFHEHDVYIGTGRNLYTSLCPTNDILCTRRRVLYTGKGRSVYTSCRNKQQRSFQYSVASSRLQVHVVFDTLIKLMHLPIIGPVAFGVNKGVNFVAVQCRTLNILFFIHITFRKQTSLQHTYVLYVCLFYWRCLYSRHQHRRFLANVNSCSCSLYVVVRPSVCLSVCRL